MHNSPITLKTVARQQHRMLQSCHKFRAGEIQERQQFADAQRPATAETMRSHPRSPMTRHPP
ncbi:hypothetical protein SEA_BIRDSONG_39 [Gordonia phage Birdsong]